MCERKLFCFIFTFFRLDRDDKAAIASRKKKHFPHHPLPLSRFTTA